VKSSHVFALQQVSSDKFSVGSVDFFVLVVEQGKSSHVSALQQVASDKFLIGSVDFFVLVVEQGKSSHVSALQQVASDKFSVGSGELGILVPEQGKSAHVPVPVQDRKRHSFVRGQYLFPKNLHANGFHLQSSLLAGNSSSTPSIVGQR